MGRRASDVAREWFADNRYQDYLYLHGLSVEMAEAMAEYLHKRIRAELGFAGEEARDIEAMLHQGYRGSRYSFGYPACPNLADQRQLLALLSAEEIGVVPHRGRPARPRAIDLGDRRAPTRRRSISRCRRAWTSLRGGIADEAIQDHRHVACRWIASRCSQ